MELPVPTHLQQFLISAGDKNSEYEVTGNILSLMMNHGRFWRQCRSAENNRINVMLSERMEISLCALFFLESFLESSYLSD